MPEPVVEASFSATPAAVLAALTARLHGQGDELTGIAGFGSVVTWQAFDRQVELVTLRAVITPDPAHPGITRLEVRRVDASLEAALEAALHTTLALPRQRGPHHRDQDHGRATG